MGYASAQGPGRLSAFLAKIKYSLSSNLLFGATMSIIMPWPPGCPSWAEKTVAVGPPRQPSFAPPLKLLVPTVNLRKRKAEEEAEEFFEEEEAEEFFEEEEAEEEPAEKNTLTAEFIMSFINLGDGMAVDEMIKLRGLLDQPLEI
jgi:hypothetical protein